MVIDELSAGLRPATPDNLPALGPGAVRGLHWAVGHYRHGILLTPITAELVVKALVGAGAVPDEFAPTRFAGCPGGDGVTMNVTINGDPRELPAGATVASVIESFRGAPGGRGVAVAVEGEVVPRAQWPHVELRDGARIEVVVAVQGG